VTICSRCGFSVHQGAPGYEQDDGSVLHARCERPPLVGTYTWPYRHPPGTKAVRVERFERDVVYLSDGSSMHVTHVRRVAEGSVRK